MLRGQPARTWVGVRFDEYAKAMPIGRDWLFSNSIMVDTETPRLGSLSAEVWVSELLHRLLGSAEVLWGGAWHVAEFRASNLHDGPDGVWALGRDVRRSLPGVYWLNVFGPAYVELIGGDILMRAPAASVEIVGANAVVQSYASPLDWGTTGAVEARHRLLSHLGRRYFYDRHAPDRATVAPDFGLPEIPSSGGAVRVLTTDGKSFTVLPDLDA